jgi:hypothetical protein
MAELVSPAPWLCVVLAILPIGVFAGLHFRFIKPRPLREVRQSIFAASAIPSIALTPVGDLIEFLVLTCVTFVCMLLAWHLGLREQQNPR